MSPRSMASLALRTLLFTAMVQSSGIAPVDAVPAFPDAEGYGAATAGGRGGQVLTVWSLADSGPGSLRDAIETPGCRFITFTVGGTILLESSLVITEGCVTIAGQTSISPGIEIANDRSGSTAGDVFPSLIIDAPNVVVRHVRVRPALPDHDPQCDVLPLGTCLVPDPNDPGELIREDHPMCQQGAQTPCMPSQEDGIRIGRNDGLTSAAFVILDHVSASWATDEIVAVMGASDVTIQNSVVSEGISFARYSLEAHETDGKGMMFGNTSVAGNGVDTTRISVLDNLFALNTIRNPQASSYCVDQPASGEEGVCATEVVNNLSYGWTKNGILTANVLGHHYSNLIGNVLRPGPDSVDSNSAALSMRDFAVPGAAYKSFVDDNIRVKGPLASPTSDPVPLTCYRNDSPQPDPISLQDCAAAGYLLTEPLPTLSSPPRSSSEVVAHVSANAGARVTRHPLTGAFTDAVDPRDLRVFLHVAAENGEISDGPAVLAGTAAFQVYGDPWPLSQPAAFVLIDSDADRMPDGWESAHCLDPFTSGTVVGSWDDSDGDGFPDLEEYVNQTAPNDNDDDGVPNHLDNCIDVPNATQLEGDATPDGFGNACDCDLNNNGTCSRGDRNRLNRCINSGGAQSYCPAADMNDDGVFDSADRDLFDAVYPSGVPGPGAEACN